MEELITLDQLAERWHCTKSSIRRREQAGVLKRAGSKYGTLPGIQYSMRDILQIETGEDMSKVSASDRQYYLRRIAELEEKLRMVVACGQEAAAQWQMAIAEVSKRGGI